MTSFLIKANLIDILDKRIYPAEIQVENETIISIKEINEIQSQYILPGFIDAHVHIESSMLVPSEFARLAVIHGTVATVSDPHEIANVCGVEGVDFMIENASQTHFKFFFGAPSCVPATAFESAGATLHAEAIDQLLARKDIWYLSEMMNYPGVLQEEEEVMKKIAAAQKHHKPVDGHAPAVRGRDIQKYAAAGITTDHESFSLEEALEKINLGIKCIIREGSAAKNFEALHPIISTHPENVMFCSDDKHPDELVLHHINHLVKRALAKGHDLFDVLRAACINPVLHYQLPVGLLKEGDEADFIIIDHPEKLNVLKTYIKGNLVAENGTSDLPKINIQSINQFQVGKINIKDIIVLTNDNKNKINIIECINGELITQKSSAVLVPQNGILTTDTEQDILKIIVLNRYQKNAKPAVGFIKNFGLKQGAIASTVAHDCHNIIAVGVTDEAICNAVNNLIDLKGGIAVADENKTVHSLALPVGGLMSDEDGVAVAAKYAALDKKAKALGSRLSAPFMSLSFMALLVIPEIKLSDQGLFDGKNFCFISLFAED